MHLVPPPPPTPPAKIVHNHYFQFPLGIRIVPREIEGNGYAKLWGVNKVHYCLSENGENIIPNWNVVFPSLLLFFFYDGGERGEWAMLLKIKRSLIAARYKEEKYQQTQPSKLSLPRFKIRLQVDILFNHFTDNNLPRKDERYISR